MTRDVVPPRLRASAPLTEEERRLIDDAVAAGRVVRIAQGARAIDPYAFVEQSPWGTPVSAKAKRNRRTRRKG